MNVSDLRETLLFLLLAGLAVPLLQRARINQMLGFLMIGLCFGPNGLGTWADTVPWLADVTFRDVEHIKTFGELGILFLMFMIGLELSPARIWALRRSVFGTGVLQVTLTAVSIGAIALWFGNPRAGALTIGITLAMSSTAVVMQLLTRAQALASPLGQACFGILMLQDLAVVPVLILVQGLAGNDSGALWLTLLVAVAKAAVTIALVYFVGRRLARPLFTAFAVQRQPEVFVALILLLTLGVSAATAAAGLSMALGALLAGLLLADTEFQYEVEMIVEPFRGLLMGMFFMSVGMELDVRTIAANPVWLPLSVVGLLAVKGGVIALLLRRLGWGQAVHAGLLMGQGGEFAFIILGYAVGAHLLSEATGQFMLVLVTASMLVTPGAAALGARIARRWPSHGRRHTDAEPAGHVERAGHIIIGGYGRVGHLVAEVLTRQGIEYVAVDRDHRLASEERRHSPRVYSGDASMPDMMVRLGIGRSAGVVLTMDDPKAALHAVRALRRQYPAIPIFARARDEKHGRLLKDAGANQVISETVESGLQLAHFALSAAGMSEGAAGFHIQVERAERIARVDGAEAPSK
ncbi:Kef-type potassium/proton antiporter, CPA2 family (TC 2.A.37.1) [Pseudoduganella flava]|uniref:Kef-type potassium/proton antiporter, CPA2 family (TC 2.A.37.1) n=1 Tax=Pseudoduganella flava TaxID=871742 RepID=A0A562PJ60_9BURK|nr:cation:proton antiporter [Pseudoduganella flava]QGZ41949.1 potassium transporter [Pseudoduganella flava]TWI44363.1 Kef-type potassium/proton antiporter, CPA2 family (TC 2.A.37.1) [Pseudoduganella flava]